MSDVDEVLAQLRGESTLATRGNFTLDREQARLKMRQFQLADPRRWILLLVRSAILRGAGRVRVTIGRDHIVARFDGPPFERVDFEDLYASMFASSDAPLIQARRDLALALNAALALMPEVLRVESGKGEAALAFVMRPGAADVIAGCQRREAETEVRVVFPPGTGPRPTESAAGRRGREQQLLVDACRWSDARIELDGERISLGIDATPLRGSVSVTGGATGRCGFAMEGAPGSIAVLQHGLVLTRRELGGLPTGVVAVVDGSHLRTDVSHGEPVEDNAWASLVTAVHAAAERSIVAVAREVVERGETPLSGPLTPAWLWRLLRARLADAAPIELHGDTELVRALVELRLWRRVDQSHHTTAELLHTRSAGYTTGAVTLPVPPGFENLLVVEEDEARVLRRAVPFAVDRRVALVDAIEEEARRARPVAAALPNAEVAAPLRRPQTSRRDPTPAAPRARHREKFLARPQRWSVWSVRPALSFGPLEVEHEGVRCTLGVIEGGPGELRDVARLCVLVERRVLTEQKVPCPLPGVDAVVAGDLLANPTWNGLGDDASRDRVMRAFGVGLRALLVALSETPGDLTPHARAVLFAGLSAPLFDPLLFAAWNVLRGATPRASETLAELVAYTEHLGTAAARPLIERALAASHPAQAITSLCATMPGAAPRVSLRAAVTHGFARLVALPILGTPARSLAALAESGAPLGGLRPRELELVRRVLGRDLPMPHVDEPPPIVAESGPPVVSPTASPTEPAAESRPELDANTQERSIDAVAASMPIPPADADPTSQPALDQLDAEASQPVSPPEAVAIASTAPAPTTTAASWLPGAVMAELVELLRANPRLPTDPRASRIEIGAASGTALAQVLTDRVVLRREHAVVAAALATSEVDPLLVALATSAVYTAINADLARITDEHEAAFIAAHARRVSGTSRS